MRRRLIRCYPAQWRARYGDEFEAILEERPLGPFDVADILLGALDAHLRLRGHRTATNQGKGIVMSLRIGGIAAILGSALWTVGIVGSLGVVMDMGPTGAAILLTIGAFAFLVALAGLSPFQARTHAVLSWAAFGVAAVGLIVCTAGFVGMSLVDEAYWVVFILGIYGALVGSTLFAIATYRTAALSRGAAALVGVGSFLTLLAGFGGDRLPPLLLLATFSCFLLGWFALGVQAIRLDRPAAESRPA
jgi:hypothetical protein